MKHTSRSPRRVWGRTTKEIFLSFYTIWQTHHETIDFLLCTEKTTTTPYVTTGRKNEYLVITILLIKLLIKKKQKCPLSSTSIKN